MELKECAYNKVYSVPWQVTFLVTVIQDHVSDPDHKRDLLVSIV